MKAWSVAREIEIRKLTKSLEGGRHVIVTGAHGIGKTLMIRQVAESEDLKRRFIFVDFSKTPGEVCEKMLAVFRAVAESLLSERFLFLFRTCLFPSETITLRHLTLRNARGCFQCVAHKHSQPLTSHDLNVLAEASGGYPLGMRETAQRLVKRNKGKANRFLPELETETWETI